METEPLSVKRSFDFPEGIGPKNIYLLYHEELESLVKHIPKPQARPVLDDVLRELPEAPARCCRTSA